MSRVTVWIAMGCVAAAISIGGGCGKTKETPTYDVIRGTVESIDPATNQVSMRWYNPNKQQEVILTGMVTEKTDIQINGVSARLEDIQYGEEVEVQGRMAKDKGSRQLYATQIRVTRKTGEPPAPATRPAPAASTGTSAE